ncbi:MAG: hypothetical protein EBT67_13010, partial [Betaproteobacteria bacterium]|nr:hypothetical protein [Betaproteobacteria bacterium]
MLYKTTTEGRYEKTDGFLLSLNEDPTITVRIPGSVQTLSFSDATVGLTNDGMMGQVELIESDVSAYTITIASSTTEDANVVLTGHGAVVVKGTVDSDYADLGKAVNYRGDTISIGVDSSQASFVTAHDNKTITMTLHDSKGTVTGTVVLSDVEAVRFTDGTTRIVGAGGYATVEEAMATELNGMPPSIDDAVYVAPITVLNKAGELAGVAIEESGAKARGDLEVAVADVLGVGSAVFSVSSDATSAYGSIAVNPTSGLWEYTLNNSSTAVQALASGQTHEDKFVIRAKDMQGAVADQTVTITISGDNDGVTITSAGTNALGTVTESDLTVLNSVGTIAFNDIDLIDTHTTSVAASSANTLGGTLTMGAAS